VSPERQQSRRSTPSTPSMESPEKQQSQRLTPIIVEQPKPAQSQHSTEDRGPLKNIEAMLVKQGKQIRVLYELQKTSLEKISLLQTQVKKLSSDKNHELSPKVFNVSNLFQHGFAF